MLHIHSTVSLCNICYRHIPAHVIEEDNLIKIVKRCKDHGEFTSVVETDVEFYYNLNHKEEIQEFNRLLFEVTDRCQLNCPHCYHLPDNKSTDKPISQVLEQLNSFPMPCVPMMAGAEPTLRKDFIELTGELYKKFKNFDLLTNGIKFSNLSFAEKAYDAGLRKMCVGLNHWSYQGKAVHKKQLQAIKNVLDIGYYLPYVGYTLESLDHLPEVLEEIDKLKNSKILHFRIRCGSFIGRSSDTERSYLSSLVKEIKRLTNNTCKSIGVDDNPYHVMMKWNDATLRLIQWPDVENIDMEELNIGPWCQFYDGPITNFVHQVITRDAYVNNKLPQLDYCPEKYHFQDFRTAGNDYWKKNFNGPIKVDTLDFDFVNVNAFKEKPKVIYFAKTISV